jgi:hypothetical protein
VTVAASETLRVCEILRDGPLSQLLMLVYAANVSELKLYPNPRTLRINDGPSGASIFCRNRRT